MRELGLTLIWMILGGISDFNNVWECSVKPSVYESPETILKRRLDFVLLAGLWIWVHLSHS